MEELDSLPAYYDLIFLDFSLLRPLHKCRVFPSTLASSGRVGDMLEI
jgi:hypothetical protein